MVSSHRYRSSDGPPEHEDVTLLRASWARLAGSSPEARAVGEELLGRWSEPHRRYHTLTHLWDSLRAVEILEHEAEHPDRVRYAVWFHDVVHEGRPGTDEEESALVADRLLTLMGRDRGQVADVVRLVELTASHAPGEGDADGAVLCDADLSILASGPDRYLEYTAAVRAEYGHLDDRVFRAGRLQVLRSLLERPDLFHTPFGRTHWEHRARANIGAEAGRLTEAGRREA
ncbi:HD domain-containing protein [Nocardiopsis salina]|uniref:HD domain-containing protein n=1 Tax=Nocardiopsis salina TaxID=245836 RepID=UPI00034BA110|nr:hypothetical protein [Nocardiopsis salina]